MGDESEKTGGDAPVVETPAGGAAPDAFSTAFDGFAAPEKKEGEEGAAAPAATPAADVAAADTPKLDADGKPIVETPAAEEPRLDAAGKPIVEAPAAEPKLDAEGKPIVEPKPGEAKPAPASADDILKGLEKLINREEPKPGEAKPGAEGPKVEEKPLYDTDETAFLEQYDKDWGDVVKGEALKRRAEYKELLGYVFSEVAKFVGPVRELTDVLATRSHLADVEAAVPDYSDQLRDDVTKWVEAQPAYLQGAYNQVITQGTPEEVKDLVERYRTATGAKPAGGQGAPKPGGKDNELSEEAKKAAAALAPVVSNRSEVVIPGDKSNFDDAWKAAAAELG